jgi:hypothetical protein
MMAVLCVLAVVAFVLLFVGSIMLVVAAFREGLGWGFAVLFLGGIAHLVFLVMHWEEAKQAFFVMLAGFVVTGIALGAGMAAGLETSSMSPQVVRQWAPIQRMSPLPAAAPSSPSNPEEKPLPSLTDLHGATGWPLNKIKDKFGPPRGTMRTRGKTILCYPGVDIESTDGETATAVVERPIE